jgi:aminoglycoside/choline kinase family phosphotransferase
MSSSPSTSLRRLYRRWAGRAPETVVPLGADGSSRRYYRIAGPGGTAIGAFGADRRENRAFIAFSRHFRRHGLPVPEIYAEDAGAGVYLEQDLGDETLFSKVAAIRAQEGFSDQLIALYRQVIEMLPRFQIVAGRDLDYAVCYPRERFDAQSIRWDLNYFKYHFLKLAGIPFDEQALEDDFDRFTGFLMEADGDYFLYRDFQSRNIMWVGDGPYFIDYQGGRRGPLQYDIASLLLDARADVPWKVRDALLEAYIAQVGGYGPVDRPAFLRYYYGYAFIRTMQAFGAYGFRGLYEGKPRFLLSIPYAVRNLEGLMARSRLPVALPALTGVWERLVGSESLRRIGGGPGPGLTVHIRSFSYRGGMPRDESGHGGGFVFDCRVLPNPGRHPAYADLTGRDAPVAAFLEREPAVEPFLRRVFDLVDQAITHHRGRGFTDLTVAFGCTGGQHRSVFCAERLAAHLNGREGVQTDLRHRELERGV